MIHVKKKSIRYIDFDLFHYYDVLFKHSEYLLALICCLIMINKYEKGNLSCRRFFLLIINHVPVRKNLVFFVFFLRTSNVYLLIPYKQLYNIISEISIR